MELSANVTNDTRLLPEEGGFSVYVTPENVGEYICELTHSEGSRIILGFYNLKMASISPMLSNR